jgi:hypothetical protein
MFDAIDGQRRIDEIAKALPLNPARSRREAARRFFERPWRYDQVVFDLTRLSLAE